MLIRRQYARAARAADQTRACVSVAQRPTRPTEMTRGGGDSLKCHQSVQSQQSSTNRCGTTSKTGEPGGSRARRGLWENPILILTPDTENYKPFLIFFLLNFKRFPVCKALMSGLKTAPRFKSSGSINIKKLTVCARQVRKHTGPLKGRRRPAVQRRLCNYLTCSYCSFMQMRGTMCDDGD